MRRRLVTAALMLVLALTVTLAQAEERGLVIQPSQPVVLPGAVFEVSVRVYFDDETAVGVDFPLSDEVEFVDADPGFVFVPADPAVPFSFNSVSGSVVGPTTVKYRLRMLRKTPSNKTVLLFARVFFEGRQRWWQMESVLVGPHWEYLPLIVQ